MAVCDLPAGTVLSDVSPKLGLFEWMFRPRGHRSDQRSESRDDGLCKCPRCLGHIDPTTGKKYGAEADRKLVEEHEFDSDESEAFIDDYCSIMDGLIEADEDDGKSLARSARTIEIVHPTDKKHAEKWHRRIRRALGTLRRGYKFMTNWSFARTHWRMQELRYLLISFIHLRQLWRSEYWLTSAEFPPARSTKAKENENQSLQAAAITFQRFAVGEDSVDNCFYGDDDDDDDDEDQDEDEDDYEDEDEDDDDDAEDRNSTPKPDTRTPAELEADRLYCLDRYHVGLKKILEILSIAIHANKDFFRPMDPIKVT